MFITIFFFHKHTKKKNKQNIVYWLVLTTKYLHTQNTHTHTKHTQNTHTHKTHTKHTHTHKTHTHTHTQNTHTHTPLKAVICGQTKRRQFRQNFDITNKMDKEFLSYENIELDKMASVW